MKRSAPAILLLTLAAGIAAGLLYAWMLDPVEYYDSEPSVLRLKDKYVYLALIGDLYVADGDLARAESRLAAVGVDGEGPVLAGLIADYLDGGGRPEEVRNLARLAEALGASGGVLNVFALQPVSSPEPTVTVAPEAVASPTAAPSPTPAPTFFLTEQTAVCAEPGLPGQIRVWVRDAEGNGLPGVEIVVSWNTGQDRFFTGLRPEQGKGYADFEMTPRVTYEVALAGFRGDNAEGVSSNLLSGVCPTDTLALDWRLAFQQVP